MRKLRPKVLPGEDTKADVSHTYLLKVPEKGPRGRLKRRRRPFPCSG
jgi:hypothetical protein